MSIPVDDIQIVYENASTEMKNIVSILLESADQYFTYSAKGEDRVIAQSLDEREMANCLWQLIILYLKRYGSVKFFELLISLCKSEINVSDTILFIANLESLVNNNDDLIEGGVSNDV